MFIVGIDLSEPTDTQDTAYAAFTLENGRLSLIDTIFAATDEITFQKTVDLATQSTVVVGLDAPLSYNPGGGDRPSDKALRQQITCLGLHPDTHHDPHGLPHSTRHHRCPLVADHYPHTPNC